MEEHLARVPRCTQCGDTCLEGDDKDEAVCDPCWKTMCDEWHAQGAESVLDVLLLPVKKP